MAGFRCEEEREVSRYTGSSYFATGHHFYNDGGFVKSGDVDERR